MVRVTYHDDLKEVQADPVLAALLGDGAARAPFDRIDWWRLKAEESGEIPLVAVARDGHARAVLALVRDGRRIEALARWYTFRAAPVISPGADRDRLLRALARDLAGQSPHITLAPLPDEDGTATALEAAFRTAGWAVFRSQCDVNHILSAQGRSFADYIAARPGALRSTLKRKANKVRVRIETAFADADWDAYERIYQSSWKPAEGSPAFLRRFAMAEAAAGRMRLGLAEAGGEAVAAQFWTVEGGTAFIHKLAHAEAARPLSAGTTLTAALMAHVIDQDRVALIDFGTGNDGYKRDWMEAVRPRFRLEMLRPGWPGCWPRIARLAGKALAGRLVPPGAAG